MCGGGRCVLYEGRGRAGDGGGYGYSIVEACWVLVFHGVRYMKLTGKRQ